MDKIYSRKRIKIPKIQGFYSNKNAKKFFSIFVILFVSIITFYSVFANVNPIYEELSIEKAKEIGTKIINESSNKVLDNLDYKSIVTIEKNNNSNVLKTDVKIINKIASEIALEVEKNMLEIKDEKIEIPIGALLGNKYLTAIGPKMDIKLIPVGNVETQIKNEFEEKGINQTIYRIYLELKCNVSIVTRYKTISEQIVNQVLLVEAVVVGDVPGAYYNLNDVDREEAIDIIN